MEEQRETRWAAVEFGDDDLRAGMLADPATSVPIFDALIAFALATRDERTVDAPYR